MNNFGITGVGMYVPERILTNEEIESWNISANANWILEKTGVKERRIACDEQVCSDLAALAAKEALKNANISSNEINLIITSTLTPDFLLPQVSSIVRKKINAHNAVCFDIQAGCAGFLFALISSINYGILNDEISNILVIGSDIISKVTDWTDRKMCSVIGDGAGAFVIQRENSFLSVKSSYIYHETMESISCCSIPLHYNRISPDSKLFYKADGKYLNERLGENIPNVTRKLLKKVNWNLSEIKLFIFPQINKPLIIDIATKLNIPQEKAHTIMHKYGYTFNSCIPLALHDALNHFNLSKGDKVILTSAGAGNHFASVALEWML